MSSDSNFLSAFTPSNGDGYHFYPPFVNFTQIGDKVKVIVRARDKEVEGRGYYETISYASMELPAEEFKRLCEEALERLRPVHE